MLSPHLLAQASCAEFRTAPPLHTRVIYNCGKLWVYLLKLALG